MKTITFHCEVITPMFLSGADGQTPDLRPPSIKGAMRFWWRALNGHLVKKVNGKWDYSELKKKEAEIFGGTDYRSSFDLIIAEEEKKIITGKDLKNDFSQKRYKKEGLVYFFYVILNQQKNREGYNVGTRFDVTISSYSVKVLEEISRVFYVLSKLGSLGSRSRRGAGAFMINGIDDIYHILLNNIQDIFSKQESFEKHISILKNNKKKYSDLEYSSLINADIYISKNEFSEWKDALDEIGRIMKKERSAIPNKDIKRRRYTIRTLDQKAAYGLPIRVRNDNELNFKNKEKTGRRSSPLYISVIKENENYRWVLTHFKGKFMPNDFEIYFKSKNWKIQDDRKEMTFYNINEASVKRFISKISKNSNKITL